MILCKPSMGIIRDDSGEGVKVMKGLIIKDLYCLKKSIKLFLLITAGVILISVLFVLSARYGNVAVVAAEMEAEGEMNSEDFFELMRLGVWLVLFIPLAFMGNVLDCFKADHEAGFSKVLFACPVKSTQIVGARYITCLMYAGIGLLGSIISSLFVAAASERFSFGELLAVQFSLAGVLIAYMGIVMMLTYLCGAEKSSIIQSGPIIAAIAVAVTLWVQKMDSPSAGEQGLGLSGWVVKIQEFLKGNGMIIFGAALVIMAVSCLASAVIMQKKEDKGLML